LPRNYTGLLSKKHYKPSDTKANVNKEIAATKVSMSTDVAMPNVNMVDFLHSPVITQ